MDDGSDKPLGHTTEDGHLHEEMVPHPFAPREQGTIDHDTGGPIWCAACEYHRDHEIHAPTAPPVLSPLRFTPEQLRRSSVAVYLACEESVADQLSAQLRQAADDALALDAQRAEVARLTAALKSIADSSCCGCCQEAALFAKAALTGPSPQTGSPLGVV